MSKPVFPRWEAWAEANGGLLVLLLYLALFIAGLSLLAQGIYIGRLERRIDALEACE